MGAGLLCLWGAAQKERLLLENSQDRSMLSKRTSCDHGSVLYICYPIQQPLAARGYRALEMWLVLLRKQIFDLNCFKLLQVATYWTVGFCCPCFSFSYIVFHL